MTYGESEHNNERTSSKRPSPSTLALSTQRPSRRLPEEWTYPKFPSLFELAEAESRQSATPRRTTSLFEGLIGSPEVLFQEAAEDPERFEPGVLDLLTEMVASGKKATELLPAELELLDRAVTDYARPSTRRSASVRALSPTPEPRLPEAVEQASFGELLDNPDVELEWRPNGGLMPVASEAPAGERAPTFWWRQ
jgi:hypothetical protein